MAETTLVGAVTMALARAMEEDEQVVVLGEDVGVNGGVFRATQGLQERFGPERVIDTPLAELAIGGVEVGMAAAHPLLATTIAAAPSESWLALPAVTVPSLRNAARRLGIFSMLAL